MELQEAHNEGTPAAAAAGPEYSSGLGATPKGSYAASATNYSGVSSIRGPAGAGNRTPSVHSAATSANISVGGASSVLQRMLSKATQ